MLDQSGPVAIATEPMDEEPITELAAGLRDLAEMKAEGSRTDRPRKLVIDEIEEWPAVFDLRSEEPSEHHLVDLARVLRDVEHLDPVMVLPAGEKFVLIDGHHRLETYRRAGRRKIPVRYFIGTPWEAWEEASRLNGKSVLPLTNDQRMNNAWKLTMTGEVSIRRTKELSGASQAQVKIMRKAKRELGEAAYYYPSWLVARTAWKSNTEHVLSDEERQTLREEHGQNYADRMRKEFGTRLQRNAEITAIALHRHLGDKAGEVLRHLERLMAPEAVGMEVDWDDLPF